MATTILYVEDNMFSVKLMQLCLEKRSDYNLIIAPDGLTAWEKIFEYNPSLILMDINLPDTTGWELSQSLRQHTLTRDIPIIAVTSLNRKQNIQQSKDAGINLHLNKSKISLCLVKQIDNLLSQHLH